MKLKDILFNQEFQKFLMTVLHVLSSLLANDKVDDEDKAKLCQMINEL